MAADIIHVFTTVRDEAVLLPSFLQHYRFADRIYVIDDHSTDGSRDLVRACPNATLLDYPDGDGFDEAAISRAYRHAYVVFSRGIADWVLVPDVDELIYHPDGVRAVLAAESRPAILRTERGYHMVSESFPARLTDVREGVDAGRAWRKPIIITPDLNVRWGRGRHWAFGGNKRLCPLTIMHYRYLGWDYLWDRTVRNLERVSRSSHHNRHQLLRNGDLAATLAEHRPLTEERFRDALVQRQPVY